MNTRIETAMAVIGALLTAVSVTGIAVTLTRQADPADQAPAAIAQRPYAPDLRDGAEVQAAHTKGTEQ